MVRDLRRLADTRFDLLVVGAGIYGAIAAWDAAARGLTVALIDKDDFGAATSFNSLKTLHGGLRSLQALSLRQMRLFIRERRTLARIAPHLVHRLSFVIPTYRRPPRNRLLLRFALGMNDAIASDRHDGLTDPALHLPAGELVSRADCLRLNPVIDPSGVTGGAVWHDYQMRNSDRMNLAFVRSAAEAGAVTANYVRGDRFLTSGSRVTGVTAEDRLTGNRFDIRAAAVVNAAGPWAAELAASIPGAERGTPAPRLSRAMNLVVRRVVHSHACGGLVDGRFLFLVPWRDVSILGTSHDAHEGGPEQLTVTRCDLESFLADARTAFPHAALTATDIRLVHRGLLPMVSGNGTHVRLLKDSAVIDHRRHGVEGLVSMFGVRYTTARQTAEDAVTTAFRVLGSRLPPASRTAETPVHGGAIADTAAFRRAVLLRRIEGLDADALARLTTTYGTTYDRVLQIVRDEPALATPLGQHCAVTGAEIAYAARAECAVALSDALLRRTEAGSAGHPGDDAVARAAVIMAAECGWDACRVKQEVAQVERVYKLPTE